MDLMAESRHFVLAPVGSAGDVHPFLGIGGELRRRGHQVTLLAGETFRGAAERAGFDFIANWSEDGFEKLTRHPDLWHPQRGLRVVLEAVSVMLAPTYAALEELYEPGRTVLVGHTLALPVRLFEEKHDARAATLHLAPSLLRSNHLVPAMPPARDISRAPLWFKRGLWWTVDHVLVDPQIKPALNAFRAELGLQPVRRVFDSWLHSPRTTIGLFPEWFGPPQPDWPPQIQLTGFPLFDDDDRAPDDPALESFLVDGEPPIVFTPGSANRQAPDFFRTAIAAADRIGRRALLLSRFPEQLPSQLPPTARHFSWVPLSRVLPRCAAIVHHGGVGTCAQGLAAGIPQLVMPMGFDQPDNALRLERLGVGTFLPPRRFTAKRVEVSLRGLLGSQRIVAACHHYREEIRARNGITLTCDALNRI
jgi:UDP:flavonoid glycosyltransferase YjiC (YdhE family)